MEFIFIPHVMKSNGIYPSKKAETVEDAEDRVINMIRNGILFQLYLKILRIIINIEIMVKLRTYIR